MRFNKVSVSILIALGLSCSVPSAAQAVPTTYPTGVTFYNPEKAYNGYTILAGSACLIDMNGNLVKRWNSKDGMPNKILPGGRLMTSGDTWKDGQQDKTSLVTLDFNGKKLWEFRDWQNVPAIPGQPQKDGKTPIARQHHDFQRKDTPVYFTPSAGSASSDAAETTLGLSHTNEKIARIHPSMQLVTDVLLEVDSKGKVVWTWKISDHVDELGFTDASFKAMNTFPPSDNLMELLMMIDAARRASAHQVVAVMPYFGWARQDRKDRPRVPIGAKLVANMLMAAGVDRVMTMDLHADQIQGFFDVPVDALYASGIFVPYIKSLNIEDLSIAAPDMGGAKRANTYSKLLGTPIIISHKERAKANVVGKMTAIGDVEGRNVLIVDDMIDTAGTICMAADMLMSRGAKSVRAAITHPVLSGPAYERINESALEEVIVTDTIPLNPNKDLHKFTVLSVADLFADVIERVHNYKEISSIFFK